VRAVTAAQAIGCAALFAWLWGVLFTMEFVTKLRPDIAVRSIHPVFFVAACLFSWPVLLGGELGLLLRPGQRRDSLNVDIVVHDADGNEMGRSAEKTWKHDA